VKWVIDWPKFKYWRSRPLKGEIDIVPKSRHLGAQYLLIDDRPQSEIESGLVGYPGTYPVGSCMADQVLHDHNDLATEIHAFLQTRSGRPFLEKAQAASDGWSQLVWDLIDSGLTKAFNRRRSGRVRAQRVAGDSLRFLDGSFFRGATPARLPNMIQEVLGRDGAALLEQRDDWDTPPGDVDMVEDESPGSGTSVILIETSESE
jgi:hypothetical protein